MHYIKQKEKQKIGIRLNSIRKINKPRKIIVKKLPI